MNTKQIIERLRNQAKEIADEGHNGWGNTMLEAADLLEQNRWIPVSERLPEPNTNVLCYEPAADDSVFVHSPSGSDYKHITHWKPLPNVPEESLTAYKEGKDNG